jgi:2-keto-4-pentenoate hydratase
MRLTDIDLRTIGSSLSINGTVEESGAGAAVLGNPINAVAWLANKLAEYDVSLDAGHVVLPGSALKATPLRAGDTVQATFDHLGAVGFSVAATQPERIT